MSSTTAPRSSIFTAPRSTIFTAHGLLSSQPHGLRSSQPHGLRSSRRRHRDARARWCTHWHVSTTLMHFRSPPRALYKVPDSSLSGKSGSCEEAQRDLPRSLASDARVIRAFDALVEGVVLPRDLTARFAAAGAQLTASTAFYYQHPPTLRLQPRPSTRHVRRHHTTPSTAISAENSQLLDAAHRLYPRCTLVNIQFPNSSVGCSCSCRVGPL